MTKFTEWLIYVAVTFGSSARYQNAKRFVYGLLENESSQYRRRVDAFLIFCIVASVAANLYLIRNELHPAVYYSTYVFATIFMIEYIARLWTCSDGHKDILDLISQKNEMGITPKALEVLISPFRKKLIWMAQPLSIIDFISIFPQFQILRIFKLFRYSQGSKDLFSVFQDKKHEFFILVVLICVAIFTAAALFYFFEQDNKNVNSFFDAVYWAVITIATVGYGDVVPITSQGRILAIFLVFGGLGVIAMLTSIVTTSLTQKLLQIKERKNLDSIEKSKQFIIIVGFSQMAQDLCHILNNQEIGFVLIDKSREAIQKTQKLNYRSIFADASRLDVLKDLKISQKATAVVCLTNSDVTNISIALAARALGFDGAIIARAADPKNETKMQIAGIDTIINHSYGAMILAECINKPVIYQTISKMLFSMDEPIAIDEIEITKKRNITAKHLDSIGCVIIGVFRQNEFYFSPDFGSFELSYGDKIIALGKPLRLRGLKMAFAEEKSRWRRY